MQAVPMSCGDITKHQGSATLLEALRRLSPVYAKLQCLRRCPTGGAGAIAAYHRDTRKNTSGRGLQQAGVFHVPSSFLLTAAKTTRAPAITIATAAGPAGAAAAALAAARPALSTAPAPAACPRAAASDAISVIIDGLSFPAGEGRAEAAAGGKETAGAEERGSRIKAWLADTGGGRGRERDAGTTTTDPGDFTWEAATVGAAVPAREAPTGGRAAGGTMTQTSSGLTEGGGVAGRKQTAGSAATLQVPQGERDKAAAEAARIAMAVRGGAGGGGLPANVSERQGGEVVKSYAECLRRLHSMRPVQKVDLELVRAVAVALGSPYEHYDIIHVAGTNGKGSTSAKLAACLSLKGHRVGIYTSPHLLCLRERIRVDNEMIQEDELVSLYNRVCLASTQLQIQLSFFETMTLIAFLYFSQREVDWAVIETGLGGRLDATNIITAPRCSVIVSIGWDHTRTLGSTLEQIAEEKAGIIKPKIPVVLGPTAADFKAFAEKADKFGCEVWEVKAEPRGEDFADENARVARAVVEHVLRLDLLPSRLEAALSVQLPLRAQVLTKADLQHASALCGGWGLRLAAASSSFPSSPTPPLLPSVAAAGACAGKEAAAAVANVRQAAATPPQQRERGVSPSPVLEYETPLAVIVDVGHNVTALNRLLQFVQHHYFDCPVRAVVALSKGRHTSTLQPFISHLQFPKRNRLLGLHIAEPEHPRAKPLAEWLEEINTSDDVSAALRSAITEGLAEQHEFVLQQRETQQTAAAASQGASEQQPDRRPAAGADAGQQREKYALTRQHARISPFLQNYVDTCGAGALPEILRFAYRAAAAERSVLLIAGTFFMTREVVSTLGFLQGPTDPEDMNESYSATLFSGAHGQPPCNPSSHV